jgi:hypothetical protein
MNERSILNSLSHTSFSRNEERTEITPNSLCLIEPSINDIIDFQFHNNSNYLSEIENVDELIFLTSPPNRDEFDLTHIDVSSLHAQKAMLLLYLGNIGINLFKFLYL